MPQRASIVASDAVGSSQQPIQIQRVHKIAFIQALMDIGHMTEISAKGLLARISGLQTDADYANMLAQANDDMQLSGFQLKILKYPVDEVKYVGFINKEADEPSKMGTRLSVPHREFFKAVIERIARAEPGPFGSVSETELQNLDISRPGTSSTQAATAPNGVSQAAMSSQSVSAAYKVLPKTLRGTALHIFVADGWLKGSPTRNNHYCLGVRTLMELGDFLLSLEGLPEETREAFEAIL